MATTRFTWSSFFIRLAAAVVLVFATYNPEEYSYWHWAVASIRDEGFSVLKGFVGVVLLIGWTILLRAALRSLGPVGIILAVAFFGLLVWLVVDLGNLPADSLRAVSYISEIILIGVLAVGVSWSHIRRRVSGQLDTDDVEE